MSDLWDDEKVMRDGDEYNERLIRKLRDGQDLPDKEIDRLMNPLERLDEK